MNMQALVKSGAVISRAGDKTKSLGGGGDWPHAEDSDQMDT